MIVTFGTQKGGVGKTTLAVAFANYMATVEQKKVHVFDFDYQKSFYNKWKEDEVLDMPKLYEVEIVEDDTVEEIFDFQKICDMSASEDIYIVDLAGTLDERYLDILSYSNFVVVPFEYSDVSTKSTITFINIMLQLESSAQMIFVRSRYDKGYLYKNQEGMDNEIKKYGKIISEPVYKRNILQNINTRKLTYDQKYAVEKPFKELIKCLYEA